MTPLAQASANTTRHFPEPFITTCRNCSQKNFLTEVCFFSTNNCVANFRPRRACTFQSLHATAKVYMRDICSSKGCVQLIDSTPGCGRSNSGSIPGILPNIVHKVKSRGGERSLITLETKRVIKKMFADHCLRIKKHLNT